MSKQEKDLVCKVAVFDLDGTITFKDTYVEFLLFCLKKRPVRMLRGGALVFYLFMYKAGFRSNHWLKAKYLGTVAGGLGGDELEKLCGEFCTITAKKNFKPKALAELQQLRECGYLLVLATASFDFYVNKLFTALDMDHLLCTKAERDEAGNLTGAIAGKNCIGTEKAKRLAKLCSLHGWENIDHAYSDDMVDSPLFEMAKDALVIDPKPKSKSRAIEMGYQVLDWR